MIQVGWSRYVHCQLIDPSSGQLLPDRFLFPGARGSADRWFFSAVPSWVLVPILLKKPVRRFVPRFVDLCVPLASCPPTNSMPSASPWPPNACGPAGVSFHPLCGEPIRYLSDAFCCLHQLHPKCLGDLVCGQFLDSRRWCPSWKARWKVDADVKKG